MRLALRSGMTLALCLVLAGLVWTVRLNAQASTATVLGTVTDMSGAAVSDALVTVKNVGTGATQAVNADVQGRFIAPELAVGDYDVQVMKTGFATVVRKGITLTVGAQTVVDFSLSVGQQTQTITVEGQVSQVETTNATIGSLVGAQQMRELPLNGRNWEQLLLLGSGVQSYTSTASTSFTGRAPSYSIAGSRPEGQALLLDDENLQNFWNRGLASVTGSSLGVEAIGEFQTLTNTYGAQFGGNGGVVNAVSKSGTNAFHGSAFEFLRNSKLDARNFFETFRRPGQDHADPAPFRRNQYGGSVGGPVVKDKAFFFVNYEGIRQLLGETKIAFVPGPAQRSPITQDSQGNPTPAANPALAQAIVKTMALFPQQDPGTPGQSAQVANQIAHDNYFLARFDYNLGAKDSIFARYVQSKTYFLEPFAGGGLGGQISLWPEQDNSLLQFSTVQWHHIISPTLVNVARASFSRPITESSTQDSTPILQFFPGSGRQDGQVNITGLTGLGGNTFLPFRLVQNRFTEADDLLWTRGAHSIRFGMSISRLQSNTNDRFREGGIYVYQSLPNFLSGIAFTFTGIPDTAAQYSHRDWRHTEITPYFQDDWKATKKLTLNLGVRWDFMTNPYDTHNALTSITDFATATSFTSVPNIFRNNPSWTAIDPRIGLAYDPFSDHKTSIRAGFGIFHNPILPAVYSAGFWTNPPWSTFQITSPSYPFAFASGNLTPPLPTSSPGFDYNTNVTPYVMQYNLNVQRELGAGTVFTVGYVGSKGIHQFTQIEENPTKATIDASGVYHFGALVGGRIVGNPRMNPNLSLFPNFAPITTLHYNSLQASVNRRFAKNFQAQASYTYSKCIDNGSFFASLNSNAAGTVENPYNQAVDIGRCSYDINHTLRVNGLWVLPFHGNQLVEGWQISGIQTATTGMPFNISNGFDIAGYQASGTPRPDYIQGCDANAGHTAQQWFNTSCFTVPAVGTLGNLGRNTGNGPNFVNTDLALMKDTRIRRISEQFRAQFRAEFFNIFNHANFGIPSAAIFVAAPAANCTASGLGCGNRNGQAGTITSIVGSSRQIQFGLKLIF